MATKPIIEVAVNDTAFQKFIELFNSYNEKLGSQPAAWDALNEAMAGAGDAGREALGNAAKQAERVHTSLKGAVREQTNLNRATTASHSSLQSFGRTATNLSKSVSGAAKASISEIGAGLVGIGETAAAALGPIGIAAAAIAAAVGAAGMATKALADAAVTRQRSAFSKGITPGQEASFGVYAQQFLGADALQAAASNQLGAGNAGKLATLGIDFNKAARMSAGELAITKLTSASAAFKNAAPGFQLQDPKVQAYIALGGNVEDLRNASMMDPAALAALQGQVSGNAGRLDLNRTAVGRGAGLKFGWEALGIQGQSGAINTAFGTIPDLFGPRNTDLLPTALGGKTKNTLAMQQLIDLGHAAQKAGSTVVQKAVPALEALTKAVQSTTRSLTTTIVGTASAAAVVAAANKAGANPLIMLADAGHESGMNPRARVRDFYSDGSFAGYSTGLFMLNDNGMGHGMSVADMMNPSINATVMAKRFASIEKAHPHWSPGEIAFAAEGPAAGPNGTWKTAYINDVNARYSKLVNQMRNTRPPTVNVKVSNATAARVAVSVNAAALTAQF